MTRYLLLFDSYGLVLWGALSDERMGLSFIYAAGPRQHRLSWVCALRLMTVFYCLRFETSIFVASYDLQGHGGGIRPPPPHSCALLLLTSMDPTENTVSVVKNVCLLVHYLAMDIHVTATTLTTIIIFNYNINYYIQKSVITDICNLINLLELIVQWKPKPIIN
jgi:hypothetical protein